MKLEVRPIESKPWHGNTGEKSIRQPVRIHAYVDHDLKVYKVGLSDKDVEELSKQLDRDLSTVYKDDVSHPFWDSKEASVKLQNHAMFFDAKNPYERIKIGILRNHPLVANSQLEFDEGKFPGAEFVI